MIYFHWQPNMSSVSTSRAKRVDPLSKKIQANPRYKNVKSTIDTGASLTKYMEKIEDIRNNYKFRKDEIFKRMKVTTFVQLIIQVYNVDELDDYDYDMPQTPYSERPDTADAEVANVNRQSPALSIPITEGDYGAASNPDTARSTLLSVARGVGELDLNQPPPKPPARAQTDVPYLLLDVREGDDFDLCHIIGALSYPKSYLSRATNYETKEMLAYKNSPGKLIIVYDEDERVAPQAAQTLVQRGYDNLFMLSGGMKVACNVFPDGLFTGSLPPTVTGVKARQAVKASNRTFNSDDINKLDMYLDQHLEDKSVGSRLSKASTSSSRMSDTASVASKATSRSTSSMISGRAPFR